MKHEYTPLKNEESLLNDWQNTTQSNPTSIKEKKYILEMFPCLGICTWGMFGIIRLGMFKHGIIA